MSKNLGSALQAILAEKIEAITMQAYEAATETELVGISAMREKIELTTSETGRRRAAQGGHPGRIESGKMHSEVTGATDRVSPSRIETVWGWEDPEQYYLAQEHAENMKFEAMESLHYSLHAADDDLTARLRRIR